MIGCWCIRAKDDLRFLPPPSLAPHGGAAFLKDTIVLLQPPVTGGAVANALYSFTCTSTTSWRSRSSSGPRAAFLRKGKHGHSHFVARRSAWQENVVDVSGAELARKMIPLKVCFCQIVGLTHSEANVGLFFVRGCASFNTC